MAVEHADHHDDVFHHVRDSTYFELPFGIHLDLPEIPFLPSPTKMLAAAQGDLVWGQIWGFQITKFMVLQVLAGVIVLLIFRGLAKRIAAGEPARGSWWNFWETIAVFIRDEVVRPTIGDIHHHHDDANHALHGDFVSGGEDVHVAHLEQSHLPPEEREPLHAVGHPADRYLPFVWSVFFYVLINNLLGAVPVLGTATGNINVTGVLAVVTFATVVMYGSQVSGPAGFWLSLAPSMDLPGLIKPLIVPMIWAIELVGLIIKHGVLAIRLFANMMAGHTVVFVILSFIAAAHGGLWFLVMPASIVGQVAVGLLELFVAFLQAYIFAFLATLFIATAIHPH